jgi:hypothetical protein
MLTSIFAKLRQYRLIHFLIGFIISIVILAPPKVAVAFIFLSFFAYEIANTYRFADSKVANKYLDIAAVVVGGLIPIVFVLFYHYV